MKCHPAFEPYVLTHLDHYLPPLHLSVFATFSLDEPTRAITVLEGGISRLIHLLPFLGGNVVQSTRAPGKQNALEVQPPTKEFISQHPILITKFHDKSIFPGNGKHIVSYDHLLNESFIPIPFELTGIDPVLRFQANIMGDGIILCFNFHHQAIDGIGAINIASALAVCCRDSNAGPALLPTSPDKEQAVRRIISEIASPSNVRKPREKSHSTVFWNSKPNSNPQDPISRKLVLDAEKIAILKKACAIHNISDIQVASLSSNVLVTAVLWLCLIRAEFGPFAEKDDTTPAVSSAVVLSEVRSKLLPNLPMSYIGNTLALARANTSVQPVVSSLSQAKHDSRATSYISDLDLHFLARLASDIHSALQGMNNDHVRQLISEKATADDWASFDIPADINISSLRGFNVYDLDFGPSLGSIRDFDLPDSRISGMAWILPARCKSQLSPWEVRLTLEPDIMEKFRNDRVIKWLSSSLTAKL